MATTYHDFVGKVNWAQVFQPNKFGAFSLNFYPETKEVRKAIKDAGYKGSIKEDDEGEFYYVFRRKNSKKIKGEEVVFGPPKVTDKDGNEFKEAIGNGSVVSVNISLYDYTDPESGQQGKGLRLEGVKVLTHIPYVKESAAATPAETPSSPKGAAPF